MSDNKTIRIYEELLAETLGDLAYWEQELLTASRLEWVRGKIQACHYSIKEAKDELKRLRSH
jgi:hypothetical protein